MSVFVLYLYISIKNSICKSSAYFSLADNFIYVNHISDDGIVTNDDTHCTECKQHSDILTQCDKYLKWVCQTCP